MVRRQYVITKTSQKTPSTPRETPSMNTKGTVISNYECDKQNEINHDWKTDDDAQIDRDDHKSRFSITITIRARFEHEATKWS